MFIFPVVFPVQRRNRDDCSLLQRRDPQGERGFNSLSREAAGRVQHRSAPGNEGAHGEVQLGAEQVRERQGRQRGAFDELGEGCRGHPGAAPRALLLRMYLLLKSFMFYFTCISMLFPQLFTLAAFCNLFLNSDSFMCFCAMLLRCVVHLFSSSVLCRMQTWSAPLSRNTCPPRTRANSECPQPSARGRRRPTAAARRGLIKVRQEPPPPQGLQKRWLDRDSPRRPPQCWFHPHSHWRPGLLPAARRDSEVCSSKNSLL